jgi:hypothetical protein
LKGEANMNFEKEILNVIKYYFEGNTDTKRSDAYKESLKNIYHDESWLTLVSLYVLFGDQQNLSSKNCIDAFKKVLNNSGFGANVSIDEIKKVSLEKVLPEIIRYREYLYELLKNGVVHLYPDRNKVMNERLINRKASLEGNTNLDAQVSFSNNDRNKFLFIEAKFLSDIDTKTKYNPIRNQIIRNIDAMIDFALSNKVSLSDVYFAMLTPKIFRTKEYGGNKSSLLDNFTPTKSRYYCFIMNEYKNYQNIKRDLPHRNLEDKDWKLISNRLGWLTFDDIYSYAVEFNTIANNHKEIKDYFSERNLVIR